MEHETPVKLGATCHDNGVFFGLWAPFATSVSVVGTFNNWQPAPMTKQDNGTWTADITEAKPGQEYKFVIKNGDNEYRRNDPRAMHVMTSRGNSVIIDQEFDWQDTDFKPVTNDKQVLYEMHVGTFNRTETAEPGTLDTAAQKLDYLADLGVTTIELMPVGSMPDDRGWGYAIDYIYAVESLYGGRRALLEFVNAAHTRGIGVILDVVYNHLGPGDLDMWQFDGWNQDGKGGIYFYNDWRSKTPWGDTRLDYGRPEVRDYILDNVRMWLRDCHLDGVRVDSTGYMRTVDGHDNDPSNDIPDGWRMLQEIATVSKEVKPNSLTIAEDFGGNEAITKPVKDGGAGFDAQWATSMPYILRQVVDTTIDSQRNTDQLVGMITGAQKDNVFSRVVYSDSHDSASNGASRITEEISPGHADDVFARRRSLLASAIILTVPGIPMLLQGQEMLENGAFNDWQALDWNKIEEFKGIVEAHKHLIALRKNQYNHTTGLAGQSVKVLHQHNANDMLSYHRWQNGGEGDDVVVVINFANETKEKYELPFPQDGEWIVRFNSDWQGYSPDFDDTKSPAVTAKDGKGLVHIGPYSVLILSQGN